MWQQMPWLLPCLPQDAEVQQMNNSNTNAVTDNLEGGVCSTVITLAQGDAIQHPSWPVVLLTKHKGIQCLTCKVRSHSMDDLGAWQAASISHQAVANLHHTSRQCRRCSTAHALKVGAGSCGDVLCYPPSMQQLGVCSIDQSPTSVFGDVLLEHLHSRVVCQADSVCVWVHVYSRY